MSTDADFIVRLFGADRRARLHIAKGLRQRDAPMSELTGGFQHELTSDLPAVRATETLAPWRRRLTALRTYEFVAGLLKTCLLSVISCGPIPPARARRHH
jgi:hypothetical protein